MVLFRTKQLRISGQLEKCLKAYKYKIRTDLNFKPLFFSSSLSSDPHFYSASCVRSASSVSLQQLKLYSHWGVPPINAVQIRGHKQKEASGGTQWDQNLKIRQKLDQTIHEINCLFLQWGQFQERIFHKHKRIHNLQHE